MSRSLLDLMLKVERRPAGWLLVLGIAVIVPLFLLDGWALVTLWRWFVVPLGVVPLGMAHALGLATLARYIRGTGAQKSSDSHNELRDSLLRSAMTPPLFVGVGWVIRWVG